MFGTRGQGQQQSQGGRQGPRRVEIKAGRMSMEGNTVTALPEKGLIFVEKDDSGLVTFNWMNRDTNILEEQLIVFPHSQKFMKCKSAPESSRVYYLKINESRHFFWMQDPNTEHDELNCKNMNKAMNGESFTLPNESSASEQTENILAGMTEEQQQLMRMLGLSQLATPQQSTGSHADAPSAPSRPQRRSNLSTSTTALTEDDTPNTSIVEESQEGEQDTPQISAEQQSLINSMLQGFANESQQQGMVQEGASLNDVLTVGNLETLLSDDDVVARLAEHLPEGSEGTRSSILETVRSPQFSQRLQAFTHALQSGELGSVMTQFGVDPTTANGAGVVALLEAIQNQEGGNNDDDAMDEGEDN